MSVIKLEVPADNKQALSAAASFFAQLSGTAIALGVNSTVEVMHNDEAFQFKPSELKAPAVLEQPAAEQDDDNEPQGSGEGMDASGLPWDKRIHSGAKSKLANGDWKKLRGVDPELVKTVEAELRQNMSASTVPAAPVAEAPQAPAVTEHPAAPALPQAPAAAGVEPTFPEVMVVYGKAKNTNVVTEAQAVEWAKGNGLTGIPGLAMPNAGALRGQFKAYVEALAIAAGVAL